MVSQGQVYECDFGEQRGVELALDRLALVVSDDVYNSTGQSVLVLPTTRGGIPPDYLDYYVYLEWLSTSASCRNLKTVSKSLLDSLRGAARKPEMENVLRRGVWPYLEDSLLGAYPVESEFCPGTVHQGFIPNMWGAVEETWFLILTLNELNSFATVAKVDRRPTGLSALRLPLTALDGPPDMAVYSHQVQPVDLVQTFKDMSESSYRGRVDPDSLERVVSKLMSLTRFAVREGA